MKFTALPVHGFEDVTLDLEQLQTTLANLNGIVRGFIDGRAATFGVLSGTGFTAIRTGLGRYTITWNAAFPSTPAVVVTGTGVPGSESCFCPIVSTTGCTVAINALPANAAADDIFSIIAIG